MQRSKWKKGFAIMLSMAVSLSSVSILAQTAGAAKKMEIPESSEMNKQDFILIKGGTFQMGSPDTENWRTKDEKLHTVSVDDFYMSAYEVTQAEYKKVMKKNPSVLTYSFLN